MKKLSIARMFALVKSGIITCMALMMLASCSHGPELTGDSASQETKELREKYAEKVKGSWEYIEQTDKIYIKLNYTFADKDEFEGHVLVKIRDSAMEEEKPEPTNWKTSIDEDVTGRWVLKHMSSEERNVIILDVFSGNGMIGNAVRSYLDFYDANDSILEIQAPALIADVIKMRRIVSNNYITNESLSQ